MSNLLTAEEILKEYTECLLDPTYPIINYFKTKDLTQGGFVPFKLFKKQREIILDYETYRFNLVTKPRQAGISTTTQAYLAVKATFADKNKPETIVVIANKLSLAKKFIKGIKDFVNQMPRWVWGSEYYGTPEKEEKDIWAAKNSQIELELPNGTQIIAVATSTDALRGYAPSYLVFDEAAFIDDGAELYAAAITSLSTGGHAILISTPNGYDPLYYKTYERSVKGENKYNVIEMRWYQDPRYNKDLRWLNETDNNQIPEIEFTFESFQRMIEQGYKPTSTWYENMCGELNNDKRRIAQELDVSFLGSGGNVIDDKYIVFQEENNVKEPKHILGKDEEIWIWEEPIEGHEYILVGDVAGGAGADYSVIQIIDFTTHEQVFEYRSKILADAFADIINEWGLKYNAYVIVDRVGVGQTTVLRLMNILKYPNLHWDNPEHKNLLDKRSINAYSNDNRIAGFAVGSDRLNMVAHLEMMVRTNGIIIRSKRTTSEMRTFIYRNNKPDHMIGYNDDCLMSLAMGLWVLEHSFSKLKKAKAQTKAILDGWLSVNSNKTTENNTKEPNKPVIPDSLRRNMHNPNSEYMWLFTKKR